MCAPSREKVIAAIARTKDNGEPISLVLAAAANDLGLIIDEITNETQEAN